MPDHKVLEKGSHFGKEIWKYVSGDMTISEYLISPDSPLPPHSHAYGYFSQLLEGEIVEVTGGNTYQRRPGMLVYHPPEVLHSNYLVTQKARLFQVEWHAAGISGSRDPYLDLKIIFDEKVLRLIRTIYREVYRNKGLDLLDEQIPELFKMAQKSDCTHQYLVRPDWFERLITYIHDQYRLPICLNTAAEVAGKHPVHISRSFSRYLSCSFNTYIRKIRIEEACFRLKYQTVTLSKMAYDLGFSDQSHFTREFKSYVGTTPSRFQMTHQKQG